MKKVLGITLLGATVVGAVAAVRRVMSRDRDQEREFERELERFEGEGGTTAG